jgi:hypothetical protein
MRSSRSVIYKRPTISLGATHLHQFKKFEILIHLKKTSKMKALRSSEMSGTDYRVTRRHIPQELHVKKLPL